MKRSGFWLGLLLILLGSGPAQADAPRVRVRLDPLRVYLGDPAALEVTFAPGAASSEVWEEFARVLEAIPELEPEPRPAALPDQPQTFRAHYRSFELGSKNPVRLSLSVGPEGSPLEFYLPLPEVLPPRPRVEDKDGSYRRPKDLPPLPPRGRDLRGFFLAGALLALGIAWWTRRPGKKAEKTPPPPPPLVLARRRLQELRARFPHQDPRVSHYLLYEVVRGYTSKKFQVELPGETTRELFESLDQVSLQDASREALEGLLSDLDRVKFGPEESSVAVALEHANQVEDVLEILDLEGGPRTADPVPKEEP